ncbi:MAG: hypothetical protein LBD42_02685 [Desulfovibrio sp.]|jgi:hypothetical protein|nr:hypothetical protein [Desulfovibrio sp.]
MSVSPYQCRFGSYSLAASQDREAVSALLRVSPDQGDMRLALQPGSDFFTDRDLLGRRAVILGRSPHGSPIFLCEMREYPVYLAGKAGKAVYFGLLRAGGPYRRQLGVLEHGFLALRYFARRLEFADEFFTAVPHDNTLLKAVAEARLSRLPQHIMLGDVQSLFLPAQSGLAEEELPAGYSVDPATADDAKELEGLLAASGSSWSYAPAPSADDFAFLLAGNSFFSRTMLALRHGGLIVGCAGVWDQRAQRQVLVEGYSLGTNLLRFVRGLTARDLPALPAPGGSLELIGLPFFSIRHSHIAAGRALLDRAVRHAGTLGGQTCALCLSMQNPLRRKLGLEGVPRYIRIYRVLFPGAGTAVEGKFFAPQPDFSLL